MLCSVLIPSRKRVDRLWKTIGSVLTTAAHPEQVEVIIRADDDDPDTIKSWASGPQEGWIRSNVHLHVGPRMRGYPDLHKMYEEMKAFAKGKWLWVFNDDAVIGADGTRRPIDGRHGLAVGLVL